jgi:hypothetical protein
LLSPTAVHADAEVHDTPESKALVAPDGAGGVCAVQLVPFHCSASGMLLLCPTAVQAESDVQETL